jgi:hypothetical protein
MISISRRLPVLLWTLTVVGALSACNGSPSSPTATSSGQASTVATTSAAPTPTGGDAQAFCGVVQQQRAILLGTELPGLLSGGTPAAWQAYLDKVTAMNQQLVDAAPAEIRDSVKTLQTTTLALKSTMEAAGYDVTKVGTAKLVQLLQTPERKNSSAALVAYAKAHCGIDLTSAGG